MSYRSKEINFGVLGERNSAGNRLSNRGATDKANRPETQKLDSQVSGDVPSSVGPHSMN